MPKPTNETTRLLATLAARLPNLRGELRGMMKGNGADARPDREVDEEIAAVTESDEKYIADALAAAAERLPPGWEVWEMDRSYVKDNALRMWVIYPPSDAPEGEDRPRSRRAQRLFVVPEA